jgi:hypothetical protein
MLDGFTPQKVVLQKFDFTHKTFNIMSYFIIEDWVNTNTVLYKLSGYTAYQ